MIEPTGGGASTWRRRLADMRKLERWDWRRLIYALGLAPLWEVHVFQDECDYLRRQREELVQKIVDLEARAPCGHDAPPSAPVCS